jgi:hypothetical protein
MHGGAPFDQKAQQGDSYLPVFATVAVMHIVSAILIDVFIPRIELLPATASREE